MASKYPVLPVCGVEVYKQDLVVLRDAPPGRDHDWVRADVTTFSRASRQRLAFTASNTEIKFTSMITLTYPREYPSDGETVKKHFHDFMVNLRNKVSPLSHLWFLEFQKRGAPHIHILIRGMRVCRETQAWVSATWYRIVGSGDLRHLAAGTRLERIRKENGARNYAVKYAFKMKQKAVPVGYRNVGRFWGNSRDVKPRPSETISLTNDDLVGALEMSDWGYLRGDTIEWRVLYGASQGLTNWHFHDMLVLSTSGPDQQGHGQL